MLKTNVAIYLIIAALALGAAAGWVLNGWRLSGQIERLQGKVETQEQSIATLRGANGRCTAAVGDVKAAVQGIAERVEKNSRAAVAAMARAEKTAAGHLDAARSATARPMPAPGGECAALVKEALEYAARRRAAP